MRRLRMAFSSALSFHFSIGSEPRLGAFSAAHCGGFGSPTSEYSRGRACGRVAGSAAGALCYKLVRKPANFAMNLVTIGNVNTCLFLCATMRSDAGGSL